MKVFKAKNIVFVIAVFAIALNLTGCSKKDKPEENKSTEVNISDKKQQIIPKELKEELIKTASDRYYWKIDEENHPLACRLIFENGTDQKLIIKLSDKIELPLSPKGSVFVLANVSNVNTRTVNISVLDENGICVETIKRKLKQSWVYVYNHQATWDYELENRTYSTHFTNEDNTYRQIKGMIFFGLQGVDYLFDEPFPDETKISTYGGFGRNVLTRLSHVNDEPNLNYQVRTIKTADGTQVRVVNISDDFVIIQNLTLLKDNPETNLYIDNIYEEDIILYLDNNEIASVGANKVFRVQTDTICNISLKNKDGNLLHQIEAKDMGNGKLYLFAPNGEREYTLSIYRNTYMDIKTYAQAIRKPITLRGVEFFCCPVSLSYFESKNEVVRLDSGLEYGNLVRSNKKSKRKFIFDELELLISNARKELNSQTLSKFKNAVDNIDRDNISDLDLCLPKAIYYYAEEDYENAYIEANILILFKKDIAELYKIRGLILFKTEDYIVSADDLQRAIKLDHSLEAELKETLDKITEINNLYFKQIEEDFRKAKKTISK